MAEQSERMTVDELARLAQTTTRNIRNYQTLGLLPPPSLVGRVGHYHKGHLGRLRLIARLQEQGFTLAARNRKPMRLTVDAANQTYTIADRTGGTVRLSRKLGADADLGTLTMTVTTSPVDIFPNGVATAATTIRITSGISTRAAVMSSAGQVRIIP